MDPQQRVLLEVAWEVLEDAGIDPRSLHGSPTGVFAGVLYQDYGVGLRPSDGGQNATIDSLEGYLGTSTGASVVSGRVAYAFGFEGPAVTIDTACSSSLVTLHLACQALRAGECSLALAGGVTIMATPSVFVGFSRQQALAADGRCKSFAQAADGTGMSEGAGVMLLERLSDARRLGHRVLAVVRGSAVNQDGASNGLTAPNGPSQQQVIRQALANAGLDPADVDAVEAHGTGTVLGDPIEAQALLATYGRERRAGRPLWLGSIKSNIGHTQAAAGVAGAIKMVMALQHELLPQTLHVDRPSEHVDWSSGEVSLLRENVPWPRNDAPRRAAISSFGISGTNAHLILEEAPAEEREALASSTEGADVLTSDAEHATHGGVLGGEVIAWPLSGKVEGALREQAQRLAQFVGESPDLDSASIGGALRRRTQFERRGVVLGAGREELLAGLGALARGEAGSGVLEGTAGPGGRVVFVFPGQGSQWVGMAVGLLGVSGVFGDVLGECGLVLEGFLGWSVVDVLRGVEGAPSLERIEVLQPVLFCVMVALAGLWRACGVCPDAVVGHSQGEVAAAYVAGGLSLEDAARIVALRSRMSAALRDRGGIASVALGVEGVRERIAGWDGRLFVAGVNGPGSTAVAGDAEALAGFLGECVEGGVRAREVSATVASHSPFVEGLREELLEVLGGVSPRSGEVAFYSTVTGGLLDTAGLDAEYWYRNLREPVRFAEVTRVLLAGGHRVFVEVSPHPVLTLPIEETIEAMQGVEEGPPASVGASEQTSELAQTPELAQTLVRPPVAVIGSLRRQDGGPRRFLASLAEAWVHGVEVDWDAALGEAPAERVPLPSYAFQRRRYWLQAPSAGVGDLAAAGQQAAGHPLLGAAVELAAGEGWLFTARLSLDAQPWLADHAVMGTVLLSGTAFLEIALSVGIRVGCEQVRELTLQTPLVLPEQGAIQLQVAVGELQESDWRSVSFYSRGADTGEDALLAQEWTLLASGVLAAQEPEAECDPEVGLALLTGPQWPPPDARPLALEDLYERLADRGLEYGPAFQGLRAAWSHGEELLVDVGLPEELHGGAELFAIHPALLDAALHGIAASAIELASDGETRIGLPFSWRGVNVYASGRSSLRACISAQGESAIGLALADETGAPVATARSLVARPISPEQLAGARSGSHDSLFNVEWTPVAAPAGSTSSLAPAASSAEHTPPAWIALAADDAELLAHIDAMGAAAGPVGVYESLAQLAEAIDRGEVAAGPTVVADLASVPEEPDGASAQDGGRMPRETHLNTQRTLELVQAWLAEERFAAGMLVCLTRGAVAARAGEELAGLAWAPAWGLVRAAQSESPGRLTLLDIDDSERSWEALAGTLACEEPQLALREGLLHAPRLARAASSGALRPPAGVAQWRLQAGAGGTLDALHMAPCPEVGEPLGAGEVRVAIRAAGLNFRDVLIALGMYPDVAVIGAEGAGVVLETGSEVDDLAVGDRVMGVFGGGFGPVAVTDHRLIARMPAEWSFVEAAAVPCVFLTAYYALVDLAKLQSGESLLVHAAAGGVGMAALQLARHLGVEVFATASAGKWGILESLGLDETHIASSRDLAFRERFLEVTQGHGVDVVLNSLAGEFVDASLGLLEGGGRFVEMGKADVRDAQDIASAHPGVSYDAFEMLQAGPERIREMLEEILSLFAAGVLTPLPIRAWDMRHAPEAFRFMSQARHVGKLVLTLPAPTIDPQGSVLVTGGTGGLGALVARHLVVAYGVRSLVLVSRRGLGAPGVGGLVGELEGLGARVEVVACDVSDRGALAEVIGGVSEEFPLRGVVHAAAVLDDGVIGSLSGERLGGVLAPKVDAAWFLHELTCGLDLELFVLFSSAAGVFGNPGQASYAAGNVFLDALAAYRRARGLAGVSIAWGRWAQETELIGNVDDSQRARMERAGLRAFSTEEGLDLLDAVWRGPESLVVAVGLDFVALRAGVRVGSTPVLLRGLVRSPARRVGGGSLAGRLAGLEGGERERVVLELVRGETAAVLGHASVGAVDAQRAFKELGFDSLLAVELRNRLNTATGLQLPATLVFDYPNPAALSAHLLGEVAGVQPRVPVARARRSAASEEPIAIVGMSCRYPGSATSVEEFWELLSGGGDAISGLPVDRGWDLEGLYDPDPDRAGTSYVREGGFVENAAEFDAGFFGISPREALAMDPQQRLLLETCWEAIEDAGIDPATLRGSQTGIFAGISSQDYGPGFGHGASLPEDVEGHLGIGGAGSVTSGRVAYTFGLEGPAVTVDTACSSSLVAMHLACGALRSGECSMVLAGGVTVLSTPGVFVAFSRHRGLAADGRCKAFADAADGTGLSEGVGVVLLERLSDARRLGHGVLAVVRGSAINQDGASNGLTAPNGPAQQRVIVQALANAGLAAGDVDAVEAHGTGTMLGDPIEAQAVIATYGQGREVGRPLWLGSAKSNIGHTQAAAGVAGVIKMVMAMRHGVLPRTLHVQEPSRQVDWSAGAVSLLREEVAWEANGRPRRAGISSFGASGTNAHVILEEPAAPERPDEVNRTETEMGLLTGDELPWIVSARGTRGLYAQARRLVTWAEEHPSARALDIGRSLVERSQLEDRAMLLGGDRDELLRGLRALAEGSSDAGLVQGRAPRGQDGKVVFVFPGQGSQWPEMAHELLERSPVFAQHAQACERAFAPLLDWSVMDVLRGVPQAPPLERLDVVQPVLFTMMTSLAALWQACGVRPDAVVGHSQGEISAAYVAGGLSLADAARVVALRSQILTRVAGAMASIALGVEELAPRLRRWEERLVIAAVNGPSAVAVSGEPEALGELLRECTEEGVRVREIKGAVSAGHSPRVESLREDLLDACAAVAPREGEVAFYSTVTGDVLDTDGLDGGYWYRNAREPVQFAQSVRALLALGRCTFVEVSAHPTLSMAVQESIDAAGPGVEAVTVGSLRRREGSAGRFLGALGEVWVRGVEVNWRGLFGECDAQRVGLPAYAFQRERFWLRSGGAGTGDAAGMGQVSVEHPLLGAELVPVGGGEWSFTGRLSLADQEWLGDHALMGVPLLPGTAFLDIALFVGGRVGAGVVRELTLQAPLALPEAGGVQLRVVAGEPDEEGCRSLEIYSRLEEAGDGGMGEWTRHVAGVLAAEGTDGAVDWDAGLSASEWPPREAVAVDIERLYEQLADRGLEYGPAFQGLRGAWRLGEEVLVEAALPEAGRGQAGAFGVHPALLDAVLHGLIVGGGLDGEPGELRLPFSWSDVELFASGASILRGRLSHTGGDAVTVLVADEAGRPIARAGSLVARAVSGEQLARVRGGSRDALFCVDWVAVEDGGRARPPAGEVIAAEVIAAEVIVAEVEPEGGCAWVVLGTEGDALAGALIAGGVAGEQIGRFDDLAVLAQALERGEVSAAASVLVDLTDSAVRLDAEGELNADGQANAGGEDEAFAREGSAEDVLGALHRVARGALELVQRWLADERFAGRLVLVTAGAVAAAPGERVQGLLTAPVWGLVRSAQGESPGRLVLVDVDGCEPSWQALIDALGCGEPQLAIREGVVRAARLARAAVGDSAGAGVEAAQGGRPDLAGGSVLVTGGTGGLGALVARHLVVAYGVRSLVLVSRRGLGAPGVGGLVGELEGLGARVEVVACDVSDRGALAEVIGGVSEEFPLRGVVHAAAVLDDGVIGSLSGERLGGVLAPKVDAAWFLHELTCGLDLELFVLFSSAAGVFGNPGQASYAAGNVFLDALAAYRRARGLAGVSIAWGWWAQESGTDSRIGELQRMRMQRSGLREFTVEEGLALLDAAVVQKHPLVVAVGLDFVALRAGVRVGSTPVLLRGLVRSPARRVGGGSLAGRLAGLEGGERERVVLELVRGETAAVLGHASVGAVDAQRAFKELGFDSLLAVELRNRLNTATGLQLPATLVFDYPNPAALTSFLLEEVAGARSRPATVALRARSEEPIAIVGMSCRYPGGVYSPRELWELLAAGGDAISGLPVDRGWDLEGLYDPDPDRAGTSYVREGGFVENAAEFDAGFFGISPREALAMDPQQRLLLETCWEAIEDAGIDPATLRGSQTGIFAGVCSQEYAYSQRGGAQGSLPEGVEGHLGIGGAGSVTSGRVAYTFGLEGPAVTVDTACSSSLVAMHLACGALRSGECSLVLAGGATVLSTPGIFVEFSRQRGLSFDGRCKSFANEADGTNISEGVGVVLLERLSDARRLGHGVLAVVRGSAINQDGASNGLTAPNGPAQQRVIVQALANAGLAAGDVDAVEAHGTGTMLGDPIEAQAVIATYGQGREVGRPLWLGSAKSNIGHTQAAAGVAGVIKMVMAMRHGVLPRTLHVQEPSRQVDWSAGAVSLLREEVAWEANGRPRRAGISSFGISGTNAHVVLEEAPPAEPMRATVAADAPEDERYADGEGAASVAAELAPAGGLVPWLLSGKSPEGLRGQARRLLEHIEENPGLAPSDVGLSLASTRTAFECRALVLGEDREALEAGLRALAVGKRAPNLIEGTALSGGSVAFLFSGQGEQRAGMGGELYAAGGVFASALEEVWEGFDGLLRFSLRDAMLGSDADRQRPAEDTADGIPADSLHHTSIAQAALFALELALFRQLTSWGVSPAYLLGHSVGELAAACAAGVFSLADGCRLVAARGRLMGELPAGGAMVAVAASEEEARESLGGLEARVGLAAVNGPSAVVFSGDEDAVLELAGAWEQRGRKTKRLRVSHAFHSPQMEGMLAEFAEVARGVSFTEPSIPIVSNLTGELVAPGELCDPQYWVRHVRETVRFADGVRWLNGHGVRRFLELGPGGVLCAMAQECIADGLTTTAVPALRGKREERRTLMGALAELWAHGVQVGWGRMLEEAGASRVPLPTYAFQRERYWLRSPLAGAGDMTAAGLRPAGNPLLGAELVLAGGEGRLFTSRLSLDSHPWLADHAVTGVVVLPGTAFLELALHAGARSDCEMVQELTLEAPLVIPERGGVQLQVSIGAPAESGRRSVEIFARLEGTEEDAPSGKAWVRHASGMLEPSDAESEHRFDGGIAALGGAWPPEGAEQLEVDGLYDRLAESGVDYGPLFQCLQSVWRRGEEVFAEASLDEQAEAGAFGVHPALLDGAARALLWLFEDGQGAPGATDGDGRGPWMPFSWQGVGLFRAGASTLRVCLSRVGGGVSLTAVDELGTPAVGVSRVALRQLSGKLGGESEDLRKSLFGLEWIELPGGSRIDRVDDAALAVLGDRRGGMAAALEGNSGATEVHVDLAALGAALELGGEVPRFVLVDCSAEAIAGGGRTSPVEIAPRRGDGELVACAHELSRRVLRLMQDWLADERFAKSRLVFVTASAVAVADKEQVEGLMQAPVWGLVRSAQSEHPGRFALADVDGGQAALGMLAQALAAEEEGQLAVREDRVFAPRLVRTALPGGKDEDAGAVTGGTAFGTTGTVLITGGTGGLGALLARHLVREHGVRSLLLASRRGLAAAGAAQLEDELTMLGARVAIVACDVSERDQLAAAIDSAQTPLRGIVHAAGVVDDGVIDSLTGERLDAVLAPKLDAAWHLHELTEHLELEAFVLFSSAAGVLGSPGQGSYAAANTFLDALALYRSARGLAGISLAWGAWEQASEMTAHLSETDRARVERMGARVLSSTQGLGLFDAANTLGQALLLPMRLDVRALRAHAGSGLLPPMLGSLVRAPARRAPQGASLLAQRLAGASESGRERVVLELVRGEAAAVLGVANPAAVEPQRAFKDLGFDSLMAIEFRNQLSAASGLALPSTLIFDYATPAAVAGYVLESLGGGQSAAQALAVELGRLEPIAAALEDEGQRADAAARLRSLLAMVEVHSEDGSVAVADKLQSASDEEIFGFIDEELGSL